MNKRINHQCQTYFEHQLYTRHCDRLQTDGFGSQGIYNLGQNKIEGWKDAYLLQGSTERYKQKLRVPPGEGTWWKGRGEWVEVIACVVDAVGRGLELECIWWSVDQTDRSKRFLQKNRHTTHRKPLEKYSNEKMRPDLEPQNPVNAEPRAEYILQAVPEPERGGRSHVPKV